VHKYIPDSGLCQSISNYLLMSASTGNRTNYFELFLAGRSGVSAERRKPDRSISDGGFLPKAATPPETISPFRRRAFRLASMPPDYFTTGI
jgi:hypothetical protein